MNLFSTDKSTFTDCYPVLDSFSWVWIPLKCFCCNSEFLSTVKSTFTVIYPVQDSLSWVWIPLGLKYFCYNGEFLSPDKRQCVMGLNPIKLKIFLLKWVKLPFVHIKALSLLPLRLKYFYLIERLFSTDKSPFTICCLVLDSVSWVWIPLRLKYFCFNSEILFYQSKHLHCLLPSAR